MSIDLLLALIMIGIIQGVLEWLPVSSEAYLFVLLILLGFTPTEALVLSIIYHLPTGLASLLRYRREYYGLLRDLLRAKMLPKSRYILIATLATALTAIPLLLAMRRLLYGLESTIRRGALVAIMLTGAAMAVAGLFVRRVGVCGKKKISESSIVDCVLVGAAQGVAVLPGVSRSAMTIAALLYRGFDGESSLDGSFVLVGASSLGAFVFVMITGEVPLNLIFSAELIVSMLLTFFVSVFMMDLMVSIARRMDYAAFMMLMGTIICLASGLALMMGI